MGLHLNYELRLPDSTDAEEVENVLVRLRDFALALPFQSVTEIYRPDFGRFDSRGGGLRFLASVIAKVFVDDTPPLIAHIDLVRGFSVIPGNGCESAAFAFMPRADQSGKHGDWFWHSSCKTQYASVISDAHLVTCHRGLVKLLDHAIELGVSVVVRDETRYWETRDEQRLISEVHNMNRIVAALAGKLSDHVGVANGRVQAPIFAHPRFERLEMGHDEHGRSELPPASN
ncbi:MAG TPA: hypothetical protein VEK83_00620 [Gemmatimonadales bacterium]|nr:hypothetical protein [Gemmatimonadales bacterium]